MKPALGVTVTTADEPLFTVCVAGLTEPFGLAVAVTVKGPEAKLAVTAQFATIAPVV